MRIESIEISQSPNNSIWSRLNICILVESKEVRLNYWFDFPSDLQADISDTDDWQAVLLLPLASFFGETITLSGSIDRQLADNLRGVSQIWSAWFSHCNEVAIDARERMKIDKLSRVDRPTAEKTLACFSGGIDSLFTLTRHHGRATGDGDYPIDEVLSIAGFNTSIDDAEYMFGHLGRITDRFDLRLISIVTNIRYGDQAIETPYSDRDWLGEFAHGNLLAFFAHLFSKRYKELIIPASHDFLTLIPWGSHPLTDQLLSSSNLSVVHDGTPFQRIERTRAVAESAESLESMHVCWIDLGVGNCCICEKCVRTMLTLDILGAKDQAKAFDWSKYSMRQVGRTYLKDENAAGFFRQIRSEAFAVGRNDIVSAIDASMKLSRRDRVRLALKKLRIDTIESNAVTRKAWQILKGAAGRASSRAQSITCSLVVRFASQFEVST